RSRGPMRDCAPSPCRPFMDTARSREAGFHGNKMARPIFGRQGTIGTQHCAGPIAGASVSNVLQNHTSQLLAGKHALVTGGARGIGAAVTRALSANGARVTMLGRATQHDAGGLAAELDAKKLAYFPADVSNSSIVAQA